MTRSICFKSAFVAAAITAMLASASARAVVIGTEDPVSGFVGPLFPGIAGYTVASDGEAAFDPFAVGFDVSDGIRLNNSFHWFQAANSQWTQTDAFTWVIPAANPGPGCGPENVNTCEMVGHFISASPWNPNFVGTWEIMDADGSIGDVITTFNTANGAEITFQSGPVPEPSEWALMAMGLGVIGLTMKRRKNNA